MIKKKKTANLVRQTDNDFKNSFQTDTRGRTCFILMKEILREKENS